MIKKIVLLIHTWILKPRYLFRFRDIDYFLSDNSVNVFKYENLNNFSLSCSERLKNYIAKRKNNNHWVLFVYEKDSQIAGYSFLHKPRKTEWLDSLPTKLGEARICSVYVEPSFRGENINGKILEVQKKFCLEHNLNLWCVIEKTNYASRASFSKQGGYIARKNYLIKFMRRNVFSILFSPFEVHLLIGSKRASRYIMKKNALTFSSYTNAYALYLGSKQLGIDFYTTDKKRAFPIPYKDISEADFLIFTEEASLKQALEGKIKGNFLPQHFSLGMLDDKWALVEWLGNHPNLIQGIKQWHVNDYKSVTFPCLLKAKHSWQGSVKLPRGWVCRSREELKDHLQEARSYEKWQEVFFIQEWLGDKRCEVISVCGFHDSTKPQKNLTTIVKRIASHSEDLSCSAAVETIDDNWNLIEKKCGNIRCVRVHRALRNGVFTN